jgi:4-amino-4-deoxy-L-arabinose transferase-like glycosyltransferase
VFFTSALLLASGNRRPALAAASLGLAVLAKSLVPLVLFLPVLAREWRRLLRPGPIFVFLAVTLPWHVLCYLRNGKDFLWILFIQQQFGRFATAERQHGQPWWFYLPVLLLVLFPWFPLLALIPGSWRDRRLRIPVAVLLFGFIFFSASLNKLPTYLTPLVPVACIVMGAALARAAKPERWIVLPVALLGLAPAAARALPVAMASGIRAATFSWLGIATGLALMALAGAVLATIAKGKAPVAAFALTACAFFWLKAASFPALDRAASARPLWLAERPSCIGNADRGLVYGLQYYAAKALPACESLDQDPVRVVR